MENPSIISSGSKDRLPTFQQLAMSHSSSAGSSSKEQSNEIETVEQPVQTFLESTNLFQPVTTDGDMDDETPISVRRIGSGSRSQWDMIDNQDTFGSLATQLGSLAATKELDLALGDKLSEVDEMSTCMPSEATYDHSEATAITGNVSSNSSTMKRVTPESSPNKGRGRRRGSEQDRYSDFEQETCKRLVMCGAVDVNDELIGSIQDVNATVRQILTAVRRFGPDEKDAVCETFKDAQYFMREKVRSAVLRKNNSGRWSDRGSMDESLRRRRGRESNAKRSSSHKGQGRQRMEVEEKDISDESEEVVYKDKNREKEQPETECPTVKRMLV